MRSTAAKFSVVLLAGVLLGGCRFKGWESFESATTPFHRDNSSDWHGDPGSAGGVAMASGGTKTQTTYGAGAKADAAAPLNASYDQPAKGSGQQPGEGTIEAAPGFGNANGPAFQNTPGSVESASTHSKQ
jgi:hypothetical protein